MILYTLTPQLLGSALGFQEAEDANEAYFHLHLQIENASRWFAQTAALPIFLVFESDFSRVCSQLRPNSRKKNQEPRQLLTMATELSGPDFAERASEICQQYTEANAELLKQAALAASQQKARFCVVTFPCLQKTTAAKKVKFWFESRYFVC